MIHIPDSIFPKDDQGQALCPKCRALLKDCACPSMEPEKLVVEEVRLRPYIHIEKSGRKGKTVTLVERLPLAEAQLEGLSKTFKTKTGSGGTFYFKEDGGVIEVQGDHRKILENFFNKK